MCLVTLPGQLVITGVTAALANGAWTLKSYVCTHHCPYKWFSQGKHSNCRSIYVAGMRWERYTAGGLGTGKSYWIDIWPYLSSNSSLQSQKRPTQ